MDLVSGNGVHTDTWFNDIQGAVCRYHDLETRFVYLGGARARGGLPSRFLPATPLVPWIDPTSDLPAQGKRD